MERVELLQLMGFSAAEAIAKATEEETIKAKFAAIRKPEPVKAERISNARHRADGVTTATAVDANGETWGRFYNPKGFGF